MYQNHSYQSVMTSWNTYVSQSQSSECNESGDNAIGESCASLGAFVEPTKLVVNEAIPCG